MLTQLAVLITNVTKIYDWFYVLTLIFWHTLTLEANVSDRLLTSGFKMLCIMRA